MVREVITGKISLPGGKVEEGEDPVKAAEREAWEESGLVVSALSQLGMLGKAMLYDCVSDSPIAAFNYKNNDGHHIVPSWFAPHYGIETQQVMLAKIDEINKATYRYPSQIDAIEFYSEKATRQHVVYVNDVVEASSPFHQKETLYIKALQGGVLSAPSVIAPYLHTLFVVGDTLASPLVLIVLVAVAFMVFGRSFGAELLFAVVSVAILALVAQVGIGFARPHVYMPDLMLADSFGFGLPSIESALMVTVLGLYYSHLARQYSVQTVSRYLSLMVAIILLQGVSSIYLGAHYFSDVVVGIGLGAMTVWHFNRLHQKDEVSIGEILSTGSVWWGSVIVIAVLATLWPRPDFANWFAMSISIAAVFTFLKPKVDSHPRSIKHVIGVVVILITVNTLYSLMQSVLNNSSIVAVVLEAFRYPILILIFAITQAFDNKDTKINK